eukprot:gene16369-22314_t
MYIDDDATFTTKLDDIIQSTDKFLCGQETYDWDDRCYRNDYPLSNHSLNHRFGALNNKRLFGGKFFFNWALFSMPGQKFIYRVLEHIVHLLKLEYLNKSAIKMAPNDHRGKLLMCASTFPITLTMREMYLEYESRGEDVMKALGLRVGGEMFREYGGNMKAWYSDYLPTHWVREIQKKRLPYLREHAPITASVFEGKPVKSHTQRSIYLIDHSKKRLFPDFTTFLNMNFTTDDVETVELGVLDTFELGAPIPSTNVN